MPEPVKPTAIPATNHLPPPLVIHLQHEETGRTMEYYLAQYERFEVPEGWYVIKLSEPAK